MFLSYLLLQGQVCTQPRFFHSPPRFPEGPLMVFYFSLSQKLSSEVPDQGSQHVPLKLARGRKIVHRADEERCK